MKKLIDKLYELAPNLILWSLITFLMIFLYFIIVAY